MTFLLLLTAVLVSIIIGEEVRIKSVDEFIDFKDNVNIGTSYSGTTVLLDSDLDLTGKTFEPIGSSSSNYFSCVFDGQGHVISNLKMTSSSQYVGLFGYSARLTIKNVIIDSSCSITSLYSGSGGAYPGGIIGYCYAGNGPCTIENNVNMGSVSFSGSISSYLYLGGIAGYLYSSQYDSTVKNCVKYGSITHSGTSWYSYIGGVAGSSEGSSSSNGVYIYNSLNHGTITHNGASTDSLYIGGIAGYTYYAIIENCVNGGEISSSESCYIGNIVGYVSKDITINYCYYASDFRGYGKCGLGNPSNESNTLEYNSITFELNGTISIGSYSNNSLVDALNAYSDNYIHYNYSKWLLNKGDNDVSFTINGRTNPIKMNYQIILIPSLASDGNESFLWFTGSEIKTPLTEYEVTSDTELYGKYYGPNYTVTLNLNERDELAVKEMTIGCDRVYGDLPVPTRTGYAFLGWFTGRTDGDKVEAGNIPTIISNHTLYAHWSINKYTITFEVDGGSECESITQDYNTAVVLPEPTKTGYTFDCWCSDSELKKEYSKTTIPAGNMTLYAKWTINQYNLTFIFNNGAENEVRTLDFNENIVYPENVVKTGYTFNGWNDKPDRMSAENITITAQWTANTYTVTFNVNGGNALSESGSKKEVTYDKEYGDLPEATRTGYTFIGWFNEETGGKNITAEDIVEITGNQTLYAHWTANVYTVSFNPTEGDLNLTSKQVTYNSTYGVLPTPHRTGFTFLGWFTDKNESATEESIVKIPADHTLYAHWLEISSRVEIVFGSKDMTRKEIERVIKQCTNVDFDIIEIESSGDETRVIVKFVDAEVAEDFVREVKDGPGWEGLIKGIGFVQEGNASFSIAYRSMVLLLYLF